MIEILVISGKGGTGKTSLAAAFAHLARGHVICDLDVDAPDMHLLLAPQRLETHEFYSGHQAIVREPDCTGCGQCPGWCQFAAITLSGPQAKATVDPFKCEGCKVCVSMCPADAIDFPERHCGHWYISNTRFGPMVHAQLFPGDENSGRLVALLRKTARELAAAKGLGLMISDGPPGIGCPVISSLSGTSLVVIVTEPTLSGSHDLNRVAELCAHFGIPAGVVINKYDINTDQSQRIEAYCQDHGLALFGKVPHDVAMTDAMVRGQVITEYQTGGLTADIQAAWRRIRDHAEAGAESRTAVTSTMDNKKPIEGETNE